VDRRTSILVVAALLSCKPAPTAAPSKEATKSVIVLPDDARPFVVATPIQRGAGYARRTYALGDERVEVTVARMGGTRDAYEGWVSSSRAYPQVDFLPPEQANGFFTCADDREAICDVHIQFRSGFHVEGMGNGRVPKAALATLLSRLNLGVLAESPDLAL
jgi:hypothetical protein